jgi:hypothetical protein
VQHCLVGSEMCIRDSRAAAGAKVDAIDATANTEELAAYIASADYTTWPLDPSSSASPALADGVEPPGD